MDKIKININTADTASLIKITGIGATSAKKIVEFCTENGPVKSEAELSRIPGLSSNIIRKIIPFIEFESEMKPPLFGKFMRTSPGRLKFKIPQTDFPAEQANVSFEKTTLLDKHQRPLTSLTLNYPVFKGDNSFVNFKIPLSRFNPPGSHKIEMIVNDVKIFHLSCAMVRTDKVNDLLR